uniref:uncharacterized protein LOC108950772 isoform X2 n=1 Tax=Ciona intestinalis TaxID=7719 RepID=UPI000EF4DCE0|nr:uncharacterized protein LOC108950772 isoform X2 [Ciona intestinalis]|eukprot:XP_026695578.1 uncharacterized protein LOC108950772 isoform X2 [Ciona intestinalis]
MMEGMGGPDGSPPFLGNKSVLTSLETVVSTLGPFVCSLQKASSRELDNIASIIGGMLGGLIGNMVAMQQSSIPADLRPMLSGMGGVAGAIGGLTGSDMGTFLCLLSQYYFQNLFDEQN